MAGKTAWTTALKQYNAGKTHFVIPRKGTKEHAEVRELMTKYMSAPQNNYVQQPRSRKAPPSSHSSKKSVQVQDQDNSGAPLAEQAPPKRRRIVKPVQAEKPDQPGNLEQEGATPAKQQRKRRGGGGAAKSAASGSAGGVLVLSE